ncbi:MAG: NAD(P)-dependent oxidoreductase [Granulosicoccus sp.]|nr:NAD(P)-dependent oxidoreductase [Granulosicoccus sp.]
MLNIGFIGLGLMGVEFTRRLVDLGHPVTGFDCIPDKLTTAKGHGVASAADAADVADNSDHIHICVMRSTELEEVVFGARGIAAADVENKILIDHSTTPVDITKEFAQRLKAQSGMHWIDAPVSGGPPAALEGTLAIMAGADEAIMERAKPVLDKMGQCTHMGPVGAGQTTKMVNQILVLNNYCVLAEALALAEAGGVDANKIPKALGQGHAGSNLLQRLFPRMIERDFEPAGYAFQVLKDLDMVHDLAKALTVPTPMSSQAASLFRLLNSKGYGELDGISVLKLYDSGEQV